MPAPLKKFQSETSYTIGSLKASLEVLDLFSQRDEWSLGELTEAVGQGKSRVFRIVSTFEECGYLVRDEQSGNYKLGSKLSTLGSASIKYEQLRWRALPPLQSLAELTGETAHIGILFESEVVTVQLVEGRHEVRMHSKVGKHSPAYASSLGKILMAYFPEPEIDEYIRTVDLKPLTANTIVDPAELKRNLLEIRAQGYAIDNEELELGLRCVATPITDQTGRISASVSISAPTFRLDQEKAKELVPTVRECARTISRMLGSPMLSGL